MNYADLHSKTQAMLKRHGWNISADGREANRDTVKNKPGMQIYTSIFATIEAAINDCKSVRNRKKQAAYAARQRTAARCLKARSF